MWWFLKVIWGCFSPLTFKKCVYPESVPKCRLRPWDNVSLSVKACCELWDSHATHVLTPQPEQWDGFSKSASDFQKRTRNAEQLRVDLVDLGNNNKMLIILISHEKKTSDFQIPLVFITFLPNFFACLLWLWIPYLSFFSSASVLLHPCSSSAVGGAQRVENKAQEATKMSC